MSTRRTHVPAIPEVSQTAESIDRTLRALKEATEVGYGRIGNPLDRFVTLRDLRDGGVASVDAGQGRVIGPVTSGPGTGAPLPDEITPPDYGDTDYTPPPKPRNVRARGMPPDVEQPEQPGDDAQSRGLVMVTWDAPDYHNHYYSEIYRIPLEVGPSGPSEPDFDINSHGLNGAYAYGVELGGGRQNVFTGGPAVLAGVATGTIFVDRDLPNIIENSNNDDLDNALNPGRYFYWVRFISRAMVPGPLSDRAEATLSINPVLVLDAMTRSIRNTEIFSHLREWLALGSDPARNGGSILQYVDTAIDESGIKSLWSVRMQHQTNTGLVYSAGFGLGMTTDPNTGKSLSTFLVNANQFAIMGPEGGKPGSRILGARRDGTSRLVVKLQASLLTHGLRVNDVVCISAPAGRVISEYGIEAPPAGQINPFLQFAGKDFKIVDRANVQGGSEVTIEHVEPGQTFPAMPGYVNPVSGNYNSEVAWLLNAVLLPAASIPFIVDTARSVVGIRGKLIVDGLVRATTGEFDELIANTAFIRKIQAETVNANLVIGQRIIAGLPGSGAIDNGQYGNISNYIVELNNPVTNAPPIRVWKPSTRHRIFEVNNQGDLYVGGHLTVGGSAVIAGAANNGNRTIFSTGGGGADTGQSGNYALWIGKKSDYGTAGELRRETNALFYVRSDGRAGFNADVFLGGDPLSLPSGDGFITVKPKQNGGLARVFCSVTFSIIAQGNRAKCRIGADLYLADATHSGPGPGSIRSGVHVNHDVGIFAGWYGDGGEGGPTDIPGYRVAGLQLDYNDGVCDVKSRAIQGSVVVPAGRYKVFLVLWNKGGGGSGEPHGCFSVHPFAVQVSNDPYSTNLRGEDIQVDQSRHPVVPGIEDDDLHWLPASEPILKGQFVNIHQTADGAKIRPADAARGWRADGWLMKSADIDDRVPVHYSGVNAYLEGLEAGAEYALGENGGVVKLADAAGPLIQRLGKATSDTSMRVEMDDPVERS